MNIQQPRTIEEAVRQQDELYQTIFGSGEKVKFPAGKDFRTASMKAGYVMAHAPELGMGMFSTLNGEAHECTMQWFSADGSPGGGDVLLCTICWLDGT